MFSDSVDVEVVDDEGEPEASDNLPTQEEDLSVLKERLLEVRQQLQTEKYHNQLLQSMYVAEKERANHKEAEFAPNFFTCVSFLLPNADFYKFSNLEGLMGNVSQGIKENFAFLKNMTADTQFAEQLKEKWNTINEFVTDPSKQPCVSCKAKKLLEDIQVEINQRWQEFQQFASKFEYAQKPFDSQGTTTQSESNNTKPSKFEEYVNKTKESVSKLSKKIENTWYKVKNLSTDFLKKKEETVEAVAGSVSESLGVIKDRVHTGLRRLYKHLDWIKRHHKKHHDHGHKHHEHKHCKRHGSEDNSYASGHAPYDEDFECRPLHKEKQSSHESKEYEEYWKQATFHPDDVVHDGFFEGNKREWRKHQKTLHKLYGRIEKLNENLFIDMDDDDIEDMYDDLNDFEDNVDDNKEQPQGLKTWLSCQLRWWKSRIQRKKRDDQLVTECGRQLMNWQLRATCSPQCKHHKCMKYATKLAKDCQTVMDTQGKPTANSFHKKHKVFQSIRVTGDANKEGTISSEHGRLRFIIDTNADVEDLESGNVESVNDTLWEFSEDDQSSWYFRRIQAREDKHSKSPQWVFDRMDDREDQRNSPDWVFERAEEREFERNKPWYYKRAESRKTHLSFSQSEDELGSSP